MKTYIQSGNFPVDHSSNLTKPSKESRCWWQLVTVKYRLFWSFIYSKCWTKVAKQCSTRFSSECRITQKRLQKLEISNFGTVTVSCVSLEKLELKTALTRGEPSCRSGNTRESKQRHALWTASLYRARSHPAPDSDTQLPKCVSLSVCKFKFMWIMSDAYASGIGQLKISMQT